MTGFDYAVMILIGLGAITGFMRGFVQEVLALCAWVVSLLAIHHLHTPLAAWLEPHLGTASGAAVVAFAILLLAPYVIFRQAANHVGKASRNSLLGPLDRMIGFGFGAIKGMLIVIAAFSMVVLVYDTVWGVGGRPGWITQARTYPYINAASEELVKMIAERRQKAASAEAERIARDK